MSRFGVHSCCIQQCIFVVCIHWELILLSLPGLIKRVDQSQVVAGSFGAHKHCNIFGTCCLKMSLDLQPRNTATDADTTTAGVSTAQAAQAHGTAPSHHNAASKHHSTRASRQALGGQSMIASRVVARTYDYSGEATCDAHVDHFLHAVDMAAQAPGQGFAAVKVGVLPASMPAECHVAISTFAVDLALDSITNSAM